ncbi:MAG: IS1634 family transposase [Nanoarchaeota archaeon]
MNLKTRITKTSSGNTAVQVVHYANRKVNVVKHIGTASDQNGVCVLKQQASIWIQEELKQKPLFGEKLIDENKIFNDQYIFKKVQLTFAYEVLNNLLQKFNFNLHLNHLMQNLVIAQVLENGSKRHMVRFLDEQMAIKLNLTRVYEWFPKYKESLKDSILKEAISVAKREFKFNFSFVLYDVTTLYFESFKEYDFQKPGFSKDNKANQPQIVIGLVVTPEGFPVHYDVFPGNTFEGHTFLEIVRSFKTKHDIKKLTVVADAAMFSKLNFEELKKEKINYIVGARLANQKQSILDSIEINLKKEDQSTFKLNELIVEYSQKRFNKDKRELDKQVKKARAESGKYTTKLKKLKYLKNTQSTFLVDEDLIVKNTKLLGIKGYTTDLDLLDREIIDYYHNLFKIEHAFRISKSDLEVRPIFHHKEESIKNHILLCFMALCISVYMELKVKMSIKEILHQIRSVAEIHLESRITGNILKTRSELSTTVREILQMSY